MFDSFIPSLSHLTTGLSDKILYASATELKGMLHLRFCISGLTLLHSSTGSYRLGEKQQGKTPKLQQQHNDSKLVR